MSNTHAMPPAPYGTSPATYAAAALERLRASRIAHGTKGWPAAVGGLPLADVGGRGFTALADDVPMPAMLLRASALRHNVALMAGLCRERDVLFAPHGKTTMAPQLFAAQLDAGAWALTAATPVHARVYRAFGVSRILLANQVAERETARWMANELATDPGVELLCLVDSEDGVRLLDAALREAGAPRPLAVLVEVGLAGTRAGCRSVERALAVAAAVRAAPRLTLAGIECFEGLAPEPAHGGATSPLIDELLDLAADTATALLDHGTLDPSGWLLSGGGSAYFDLVADRFATRFWRDAGARVVLRSGCYITHDGGFYERQSPLAGRSNGRAARLRNAVEVWSAVLSRPEPGLVITSMGRRDAPYDQGLPTPFAAMGTGGRRPLRGCRVVALSDQHAHVEVPPELDLRMGELVGCTVSHPCGAFDRWRVIPVVDDDDVVVDAIATLF